MAKRPLQTPGYHGGPGFDPLDYSPSPNWDPPPPEDEDSLGKAIGGLIFGGLVWAAMEIMEADNDDDDEQGTPSYEDDPDPEPWPPDDDRGPDIPLHFNARPGEYEDEE